MDALLPSILKITRRSRKVRCRYVRPIANTLQRPKRGLTETPKIIGNSHFKFESTAHRITYSAFGGRATYHLSTMQVIEDGIAGSKVIGRSEFKPTELLPLIEQNMQTGSQIMKQHIESKKTIENVKLTPIPPKVP